MIFAVLFVIAFLIGLVAYLATNRWLLASAISTGLFVITTLADAQASAQWGITLIFGLPIVFVASLLGAYVVEIRRGDSEEHEQAQSEDSES